MHSIFRSKCEFLIRMAHTSTCIYSTPSPTPSCHPPPNPQNPQNTQKIQPKSRSDPSDAPSPPLSGGHDKTRQLPQNCAKLGKHRPSPATTKPRIGRARAGCRSHELVDVKPLRPRKALSGPVKMRGMPFVAIYRNGRKVSPSPTKSRNPTY